MVENLKGDAKVIKEVTGPNKLIREISVGDGILFKAYGFLAAATRADQL